MMHLQKYLSENGIMSRRESEVYIRAGKVLVNGKVAVIGVKIDEEKDDIKVIGQNNISKTKETVIINKPRGIVSSKVKNEGKTVYDLFPQYENLNITGRLDKESAGLVLLTNDGVLARKITGDNHEVEKEYQVSVREDIKDSQLSAMASGLKLNDGMTLPAKVSRIGRKKFSIILKEGKNHQIRRMADKVHLTITDLYRVRIGNIQIGQLKEGKSRKLIEQEINVLLNRN